MTISIASSSASYF